MSVNLNNSSEFVKEVKIFNDGKAGIVDNVKVRIDKRPITDTDDKKPIYKLIATDSIGEINEGFYYQEPDSKGFNNYQAQKLIMLARGVLGNDVKFPVFNTPKETLDGIMAMVAPALNKPFRVAACYGTTKKRSAYLGFKPFGSFIQPMSEPNTLALQAGDALTRAPQAEATAEDKLVAGMTSGSNENLAWLEENK